MIKKYLLLLKDHLGWSHAQGPLTKIQITLTVVMQLAFITSSVVAVIDRQWLVLFVSLVAMVAIWMPYFVAVNRRVFIPAEFQFFLTFFIYASLFLGELRGFYTKFWWWDIVLHAGSGVALGFIGFLILFTLYRHGKMDSSPLLFAIFSFCFALSLGALWEIFEFIMDTFFDFNMQRTETGVNDTMRDLIVDASGTLFVSIIGYYHLKQKRKKSGIFQYYLNTFAKRNPFDK